MNIDLQQNEGGASGVPSNGEYESLLTRWIGWLAFVASVFSAFLVVVTLGITGFSVFRRYVLGRPVTWTDELSGFLVVAIVMLGAAEVLRRGEHVSVDILTAKLSGTKKWFVEFWSNISVAIVAGVLSLSAINSVQFSYNIGVYSDGYLEAPLWIPQLFLLAGAVLLLLLALARSVDLILFRMSN